MNEVHLPEETQASEGTASCAVQLFQSCVLVFLVEIHGGSGRLGGWREQATTSGEVPDLCAVL